MNQEFLQEPCPRCAKPRAEWTENEGVGYEVDGRTYCSQRCAEESARPESREAKPES